MIHSIQMTEEEALGLTAERFDEPTLINHLMPLMVNTLLITRGERGVTAIVQNNKRLSRHDIPGSPSAGVVDTTGCGDVFAGAFLHAFLSEKNPVRAAEFANQAAAVKATFRGTDGLQALRRASLAPPVNP